MTTCAALVVAAGRGSRFGAAMPKQYADLGGSPVLRYSLLAFCNHPAISRVQPVIHPDDQDLFAAASADLSVTDPVFGGETRQDSVRLGLEALAGDAPEYVLIHDGARPNIGTALIDRVLQALSDGAPGVVPALSIPDTLKRIGENAEITETLSRTNIVRAQTPQGFHFQKLWEAHRQHVDHHVTDDAAVMEKAGHPVVIVPGEDQNIKITDSGDLARVSAFLMETRIGSGFDVHRFCKGDGVTLGGVFIPMDKALQGHSDADVVLHAVTDAILGALGDGDIGVHFPPTDEAYKDADSRLFLSFAMERLRSHMGSLTHLDITVICEQPKLSPVREQMRQSIAEIAGVAPSRVSVKATTTEGLGFTGRGEGIACQAMATIQVAPSHG